MLKVLAVPPYFAKVAERYRPFLFSKGIELTVLQVPQFFQESELLELISDFDGVIAGDDEYTAKVMDAAPRLRVIVKWGVGIDSIDIQAAKERGIEVRRSAGALSEAVSDVALGYLLMLARHLHTTDRLVREGKWIKQTGRLLQGRTLGIIGVGDIGKQVAWRARAFGLRLVGCDVRTVDRAFLFATELKMKAKDELLACSDFVVLACDLNPSSYHIIDTSALEKMKNDAYLINIARGPLVDEQALCRALGDKKLAGAALDVFEFEPLAESSPLRAFENVILGSHNAFNADSSVEAIHNNTVRELVNVLLGEELTLADIEMALRRC